MPEGVLIPAAKKYSLMKLTERLTKFNGNEEISILCSLCNLTMLSCHHGVDACSKILPICKYLSFIYQDSCLTEEHEGPRFQSPG